MSGRELSAALATLGWSRRHLAGVLGCDPALVSLWVRGAYPVPRPVGYWVGHLVDAVERVGPPPREWRVNRAYGSVSGAEAGGSDGDGGQAAAEDECASEEVSPVLEHEDVSPP